MANTDLDQLAQARREAQDTYARRRARRAAETLATVDPELWDDHTRTLVRKMGAYHPDRPDASWVDLALDAAFGPEGTEDIRVAMAADLRRQGLMAAETPEELDGVLAAGERYDRAAIAEAADRNAVLMCCEGMERGEEYGVAPHSTECPRGCDCPPHPVFRHVDACPRSATDHDNGDYRA